MIHSYSKIKTDGKFNEDFKTYATVGILQYLPVDLFWGIIRSSTVDSHNLPDNSGEIIQMEFWPRWYNLKNIDCVNNSKYIEPDIFIKFEMFDCIIEVKKSDYQGQYQAQWLSQSQAYFNEYGPDKKLVYIALGGNINLDETSSLKFVHKATWQKLLKNVNNALQERLLMKFPSQQTKQEIRILNSVVESFSKYNEYIVELLDTLKSEDIFLPTNKEINSIWKI